MEAKAKLFAQSENATQIIHSLNSVFRRLLANLLLDFENPKFRKVRPGNEGIKRNTEGLSPEFVSFLFGVLGFTGEPDADGFVLFSGSKDTLKSADNVYSVIESTVNEERNADATFLLRVMAQDKKSQADEKLLSRPGVTTSSKALSTPPPRLGSPLQTNRQSLAEQMQEDLRNAVFNPDDFSSVTDLVPIVRKVLLRTGRIRNSFFDSKDLTLRRMAHGRVYVCSEKCDADCLEAHWHLFTGKGMVYAYVAHLSSDGKTLLHTGAEQGYQYNSMPGTPNFGKTVHFTEKLVAADGTLVFNKHPNKVADSCIYCGQTFYKLFL